MAVNTLFRRMIKTTLKSLATIEYSAEERFQFRVLVVQCFVLIFYTNARTISQGCKTGPSQVHIHAVVNLEVGNV